MVLQQGDNTVNFVNLSTTTSIESWPQQTGKSVTKFRDTDCQGKSGIGRGCNKPYGAAPGPLLR
jgi:hypothetical protein